MRAHRTAFVAMVLLGIGCAETDVCVIDPRVCDVVGGGGQGNGGGGPGGGGEGGEGGGISADCAPTEGLAVGASCGVFVQAGATGGDGSQASPYGSLGGGACKTAERGAGVRVRGRHL